MECTTLRMERIGQERIIALQRPDYCRVIELYTESFQTMERTNREQALCYQVAPLSHEDYLKPVCDASRYASC